jgi:hypothetical protein
MSKLNSERTQALRIAAGFAKSFRTSLNVALDEDHNHHQQLPWPTLQLCTFGTVIEDIDLLHSQSAPTTLQFSKCYCPGLSSGENHRQYFN